MRREECWAYAYTLRKLWRSLQHVSPCWPGSRGCKHSAVLCLADPAAAAGPCCAALLLAVKSALMRPCTCVQENWTRFLTRCATLPLPGISDHVPLDYLLALRQAIQRV